MPARSGRVVGRAGLEPGGREARCLRARSTGGVVRLVNHHLALPSWPRQRAPSANFVGSNLPAPGKTVFVRLARADSLGRGPCHILGLAGCREAPSQMSLQTLPSVGNLVAVKLAGHLGVTGSPAEACWELAADAHREAARGGGSASALRQRAARRSRRDPPPSKRHFY